MKVPIFFERVHLMSFNYQGANYIIPSAPLNKTPQNMQNFEADLYFITHGSLFRPLKAKHKPSRALSVQPHEWLPGGSKEEERCPSPFSHRLS